MPYIKQEDRPQVGEAWQPKTIGDLNYFITIALTSYLEEVSGGHPRYADYNAVIGVLECAKLELYRRVIASYEDRKCAENGDVY